MNFVKFKDCYVRAGLGVDKQMVSQCQDNYRNFDDLDGAVVMDWGMNIGAFGVMMASYPIKQYIGVEPHPENFEVAVKNLNGRENFTLINAAVTTAEVETLNLCLTKSKQNLCSGATNIKSNGARGMRTVVIPVKAINAVDLLDKYQPTHLKCDIEGEEYRIFGDLDWKIPACIKQLALEYHWQDKVLAYESFRKRLTEQGFTPVYEELNYIKGTTEVDFLGKKVNYRNIWGLDCLYKR